MDSLFESAFSPLAATGKPLTKCGKCRRYMKYVRLRPQRLHCASCDETYSLPQNGTIKQYKVGYGCCCLEPQRALYCPWGGGPRLTARTPVPTVAHLPA